MADPKLMLGTVVTWKTATVGKCTVSRITRGRRRYHECSNFDTEDYAEFTAGLKDVSALHVECYMTEDDVGIVAVASDDGTEGAFSVTYPNGWSFSGTGTVENYEAGGSGAEGHVMFSFDIRVPQDPTPTP